MFTEIAFEEIDTEVCKGFLMNPHDSRNISARGSYRLLGKSIPSLGMRLLGGALCLLLTIAGARAQAPLVTASAPTVSNRTRPPANRRVYVPLNRFKVVIDQDKKGVLLPRKEFQKLYSAAHRRTQTMPRQPRGIVLSAVEYQARVSGSRLVISATIPFTQFTDDWQILALPLQRMAVESAMLDGQPARIGREKGVLQLFNNRSGRHVLTLELSAPLTAVGSDKVVGFGLIPAPSAVLKVTIFPGSRLLVNGLSIARPAPPNKQAVYQLPVGGASDVWLQITQRETKQSIDSLLFAQTRFGLNVSPGEVTWVAETSVDVYGRTLDRLVFSVPRSLEIIGVSSTGLASWRLDNSKTDSGRTKITLAYQQPFDGTRPVTLQGVLTPDVKKPWAVPNLKLAGAMSHVGRVFITHPAGVRLKIDESSGVRSVSTAVAESAVFDVWQEEFTLRYITETKQRELSASALTRLNVMNKGIDLNAIVRLRAFYAPLFEFDMTLPASWQVTAVEVRGKPIVWNKPAAEAGLRVVRIPLDPPLLAGGSLQILLSARRNFESPSLSKQPSDIALPEVRLPQVSILDGVYAVSSEEEFDIEPEELTGLDPAPLKISGIRLGYRYQETHFSGRLKITRRASRISARTLQFTRLDPGALRSHIETTLDILGGSTRTLRVALPAATGRDLRFRVIGETARIVEQKPSEPVADERTWTLRFDRRLKGRVVIAVDVESPRGTAKRWLAHQLRIPDAERQYGVFAIEAGPEQWLTLTATAEDKHPLDEVDPAEIPPSQTGYVPRERIVAVYRSARPGATVSLSATRLDRLAVPTAVCYQSEISSVLGHSGEMRYRAKWTLTAVGVQSLRIELPDSAVVWSTLLNGRPVEIRRSGDVYLIPLPPTGRPTDRRDLMLFYTTQLTDSLSRFGRIQQHPPRLSALAGDGQVQPIEMLNRVWNLSYPSEVSLIGSDGRFQIQTPLDRSSLLGRFAQSFHVASPTQILWDIGYLAAGVLLILGYRRYAYRNLNIVGGALVVFSLIGLLVLLVLFLPPFQQKREAATGSHYKSLSRTSDSDSPMTSTSETGAMQNRYFKHLPMAGSMDEAELISKPKDARANAQKKSGGKSRVSTGARLSVVMTFVKPAGNPEKTFRYFGSGNDVVPDLDVVYQNRQAGLLWRLFLVAAILFGFWTVRSRSLRMRSIVGTLGMTIPLAVISIAPVTWGVTLDGLFLGSLGGTVLWGIRFCVRSCSKCRCCSGKLKSAGTTIGTIAGLLLLVIGIPQGNVAAASPKGSVSRSSGVVFPRPTVVIPYDPAGDPLAAERVYLPHAEFVKLWNKAHPKQRIKKAAPRDGLVAGALYTAELKPGPTDDTGRVAVTARIVLYNLRDRAVTLSIPLGAVALRSARLDGKNAPLISGAPSVPGPVPLAGQSRRQKKRIQAPAQDVIPYQIVLATPGIHLLDLEFDLPVEQTGPAGRFQIPLGTVPAGRLRFTLPSKNLSVRVNGTTGAFRLQTIAKKSVIDVPIDSGGNVTISWQPRTNHQSASALTHVEASTLVHIDDAGVTVRGDFRFRVRQGFLSDVTFSLPEDVKLKEIHGADVGGWEKVDATNGRAVRVFLRRKVNDSTNISLVLYRAAKIGETEVSVDLPQFSPRNVVREKGTVGIVADSQFAVYSRSLSELKQIDLSQFVMLDKKQPAPETMQSAYRYSSRPIALTLVVARRKPVLQAVADQSLFIGERKIRMASRFSVNITGEPRSRLTFYLPENYLPLTVASPNLSDWYLNRGDEETTLTVELDVVTTGNVVVYLNGAVPKEPGAKSVDIETPSPLDINRLETRVAVRIDPMYSATLDTDELEGWRSIDPARLPSTFRRQKTRPVQFAFTGRETEPSLITFGLSRASVQLTAAAVTITTLMPTAVNHTFSLEWTIRRATLDHFSFLTPAIFKDRLEFTGAKLRQIRQSELADGRIRWTVTTQQPVANRFFLIAMATLPSPTTMLTVPVPVFQHRKTGGMNAPFENIETQSRYGVLVNQSSSQLTPTARAGVEKIEARDLPIHVQKTLVDQAMEIVRFPSGKKPFRWKITRFQQQKGVAASVNLADLITVFERDGSWRTQATYTLRNRSRQFLALEMPTGSQLLSVFVQKRPARPVELDRNGRHLHLIALPKTSAADLSFPVRILFSGRLTNGPLTRGLRISKQHIRPPSPKVLSPADDSQFGIPVARTIWTVWLPKGLDVEPLDDPDRSNLTEVFARRVDLARRGLWLQDAAALVNLYDSSKSSLVKDNARKNLRKLQTQQQAAERNAHAEDLAQMPNAAPMTEADRRAARHERLKYNKNRSRIANDLETRLRHRPNLNLDLPTPYSRKEALSFADEKVQRQQFGQQARDLYRSNSAGQAFHQHDEDRDGFWKSNAEAVPQGKVDSTITAGIPLRQAWSSLTKRRQRWSQQRLNTKGETEALIEMLNVLDKPVTGRIDWERKKWAGQRTSKLLNRIPKQLARNLPGGLGGGVAAGQTQQAKQKTELKRSPQDRPQPITEATTWTQAGGLSLEILLPTSGRKLTFSKVGGDPKLELALRPRKTIQKGFDLLWTVIWLVIGLGMATALSRRHTATAIRRHLSKGVMAVGLIAFFLLPAPLSWLGFLVFFLGTAAITRRHRRISA